MSLKTLIDKNFHKEAKEKYNTGDKNLRREAWLSEYGLSEKDVLMDEEGKEFVYVQSESDHSERYEVWYKKVELPYKLQTYYVEY